MSDPLSTASNPALQKTQEAGVRPHKRMHSATISSSPSHLAQAPPANEGDNYTGASTSPAAEDQQAKDAEPTKEELYAQAKAKKIAALEKRNIQLEAEIERVKREIEDERVKLVNQDAAATVKTHIRLLHEYNEIRDVGQGMIGMIAENREVRVAEVYESGEFGVAVKD